MNHLEERQRNQIGIGLLVLSLVLIGFGVLREEPALVLQKAINICMECIGIG